MKHRAAPACFTKYPRAKRLSPLASCNGNHASSPATSPAPGRRGRYKRAACRMRPCGSCGGWRGETVTRPILLDLFCGAGGCSVGYHRAGFDVIGVDHEPQPRYPFQFVQADALAYLGDRWLAYRYDGCGFAFHAIHASPPCQRYSRATAWRGKRSDHPDLLPRVRELIEAVGVPYVIENVQEARRHLHDPFMLCGSMFGLKIRRHRFFQTSFVMPLEIPPCQHRRDDFSFDHGGKQTESEYRAAMGCDWMTVHEAREAIPPPYCEFIGRQLLNVIEKGV